MLTTLDLLDQLAGHEAGPLEESLRAPLMRVLRLTPLPMLLGRRAKLVAALALLPEADHVLRPTWARQDPVATARLYIWVEAARRRSQRGTGHHSTTRDQREHDCYPLAV